MGRGFGDKCLEREIQREESRGIFSFSTTTSTAVAGRGIRAARRKTIYFEGRKLHYQAERAQSIMTFPRFAAATATCAIASPNDSRPGLFLGRGRNRHRRRQRLCYKLSRSPKTKPFARFVENLPIFIVPSLSFARKSVEIFF